MNSLKRMLVGLALVAGAASAEDWYKVPLDVFQAVEVKPDRIILSRAYPNWDANAPIRSNLGVDWQVNKVILIPPAGMLNAWEALVLTGQATGRSLWVKAGVDDNIATSSQAFAGDNRIILE